MNESDYQKAMEHIQTPEELKQRTLQRMREEKGRKPHSAVPWKYLAAAACLCLLLGGGIFAFQSGQKSIYVEAVETLQVSSGTVGVLAGKKDGKTPEKDTFSMVTYGEREFIPEELWEIKSSSIKGQEVHICLEEDTNTYYAAAERDGKYLLIRGKETTERKFEEYLESCFL